MASTRSIISTPTFASTALTVIPPTPVAGVSYRDPAAGPARSPDGWPYGERVNSAEFNQIMFQSTTLLSILDKKGILGWSSGVNYTEASLCFGSDGEVYKWVQSSGPDNGGAKDPVSQPLFWLPALSGRLLKTTIVTATGTFTPDPRSKTFDVTLQGAGGGGGGAVVTGTSIQSVGGGGGSGGIARGMFTAAQIGASIAVTLGAGGTGVTGADGNGGGASSFGSLLTATGGSGGAFGAAVSSTTSAVTRVGSAGSGSSGNIYNSPGIAGSYGLNAASGSVSGGGGGSPLVGGGGGAAAVGLGQNGLAGVAPGSGGSGAANTQGSSTRPGGSGVSGAVLILEYA